MDGKKAIENLKKSQILQKAILFVRMKKQSHAEGDYFQTILEAVEEKKETLDSDEVVRELTGQGYQKMEVQYNPSSVTISTGTEIKDDDSGAGTEKGSSGILSANSLAVLSFDLIFEATELTKNKNYVRQRAEGLLSLMAEGSSSVIFYYAGMQFYGELQSVKIKYTMFDNEGNPIWAVVSISIQEKDEEEELAESSTGSQQIPAVQKQDTASASYEYDALETEYDKFLNPVTVIKINQKDINQNKSGFAVSDVEIDLTSGYEASLAVFCIYNSFDKDQGAFRTEEIKKYIFLGSSVSISAGYGEVAKNLFRGFISKVSFLYEDGEMPHVQVTCMDVKGIMMAGSYARQLAAANYSDAVNEVFQKAVYVKMQSQEIFTKLDISATPDKQPKSQGKEQTQTIEMVNESDYEFVVRAAKKFNFEFYVDSGVVYFRKAKAVKNVLMNLTLGKILKKFDVEYDITGLVESIQVRGMDTGKMKLIKSKQKSGEKISMGNKAQQLLKKSEKIYIDPTVRSQQDAQYRNEYLLEDMSYRFGTLNCECQGLPELRPGNFVRIDGLGKPVENKFYVTSVKHTINSEDGFVSKITAKAASVQK